MSEVKQPAQGSTHNQDNKYQLLEDDFRLVQIELDNYKSELRKCNGEIRSANHYIKELHHEKQRWKDHIGGLQNDLTSTYQQLEHAKTLSEVLGKELLGVQVSSTKVDTLSISKNVLDGAAAKSQKMAGETPAEGAVPRGTVVSQLPTRRPPNDTGHFPQEEQQEKSETKQKDSIPGVMMSSIPAAGLPPSKHKYQILNDEFRRAQNELDNHKRELRRCFGERRSVNHNIQELLNEKQRWKDHAGGLEQELSSVRQQLKDAKALSKARGKKLFGAQVFSTEPDDMLSVSEVGEKVAALNEEIFQAAATLGEAITHKRHDLPQKELDAATAESQEMVGEKLSKLLIGQAQKSEPDSVNPLLVQVVLQIFMVKFCVSKIQSWYPSDSSIAGFLDAIYSEIRLTEEQAVSGRWRALTRAHTRPTIDTWTNELSKKLRSVLKIAAWNPGSLENQESFRRRLPLIFKAVTELRIAIGENFTSANLDVSVFDCCTIYDSSYMDDAYGDGRQPSDKRTPAIVAGTTGIGLKKIMAEHSTNGNPLFQNMISAKIVLESTLKEALDPVQSSGGRVRKNRKKPVERADGADGDDRAYEDGRD